MAKTVEDHIHLDSVTPPVATYPAAFPSLDFSATVPVIVERAWNGTLHVHRTVDGGGDPYQFISDRMMLTCTLAEMVTVKALHGKQVYYVPNYHDAGHPAGEIITSYLIIPRGGIRLIDPMGDYWQVMIEIVDDDTV